MIFVVPGGNIRLALAAPPPDAGYRLGTPSSGYLIAIEDNGLFDRMQRG